MTTWAELGLPCALRAGYGWQRDAGLARTPFADALPEQALARAKRSRTYRLAWALSGDQLALAEEHLLTYGYGRLGVLLTLPSAAGPVAVRLRLTEDLEVSAIQPDLYRLEGVFESIIQPPAIVDAFKLNLYALLQGIATGAGVHKTNLYSVFNVLADQSAVLKANQYVVYGGIASGSAVSKTSAYAVTGGIASGSAASKVSLYAIIVTA